MVRAALAPFTFEELWRLPAPCRVEAGGESFVLVGICVPRSARTRGVPVVALLVQDACDGGVLPLRLPFPWTAAVVPGSRVLLAGLDAKGRLTDLPPRDVELWMDTNRHEVAVPPLVRMCGGGRGPAGGAALEASAVASLSHALAGTLLQAGTARSSAARLRAELATARIVKRLDLASSLRELGSTIDVERDDTSSADDGPVSEADSDDELAGGAADYTSGASSDSDDMTSVFDDAGGGGSDDEDASDGGGGDDSEECEESCDDEGDDDEEGEEVAGEDGVESDGSVESDSSDACVSEHSAPARGASSAEGRAGAATPRKRAPNRPSPRSAGRPRSRK